MRPSCRFVILSSLAFTLGAQAQNKVIDDFQSNSLKWKAQANSRVSITQGPPPPPKENALKWTFTSDGATPYDNAISLPLSGENWAGYVDLVLDFYAAEPVTGRIGCQVVSHGMESSLQNVNPHTVKGHWAKTSLSEDQKVPLEAGKWQQVKISIEARSLEKVTELRFFCDGRQFSKGPHVFYLRNIHLQGEDTVVQSTSASAPSDGTSLPKFSSLSEAVKASLRHTVEAPPLAQRRNPYSVFMCYPMWGVKDADGQPMLGSSPDGKSHPEWQETLVRDWAELGLTQLHFYLWPNGCGTPVRDYKISEDTKAGIREFARLCQKYQVKIGLRVDPPYFMERKEDLPPNQDPTGDYWPANPHNPQNELKQFFPWLVEILGLLEGNVEYVVMGDEIDPSRKPRADGHAWDLDSFMKFTKEGADAVHAKFPNIKVSGPSFGAGNWNEVTQMIDLGYANFADAVAINNDDYKLVSKFVADLERLSPHKKIALLSNGIGYVGCDTKDRNPPQDLYRKYSDADQAGMISRAMYSWWDVDADVAPYYVPIRTFIYQGKRMPLWYGMLGFVDFALENSEKSSTVHYPGWSAYQTIAQTFHDRRQFSAPAFTVESSSEATLHLKAYERPGQELLIILWGEDRPGLATNVRIPSLKYGCPVQVNLLNHQDWADVASERDGDGLILRNVPLGLSPTIIRLFPNELAK